MPIQIPIKIKLNMKFDDIDSVRFYFQNHQRLLPVEIGVHTSYAEEVENGTIPYKEIPGKNRAELYRELLKWAKVKYRLNDKDAKETARYVTDRIWEHGMVPHRFFAPSIQWLMDNMQELFDQGYSLPEIADEAVRRINWEIHYQNLIYSGDMLKSLETHILTKEEAYSPSSTSQKMSREDLERMGKEIWNQSKKP